jgi:signal transduction histidine kinase
MSHELHPSTASSASAGVVERPARRAAAPLGAQHPVGGERLLNLINDILDLSKIEAGKMQMSVSTFEVLDACEGVLTMFQQMAEKKNIDLRGIYAQNMPKLRQDMTKLQQILNNLVSNAIKFTPEGGRVQLKVETTAKDVVLTVTDTGVGIARRTRADLREVPPVGQP